MRRSLSILVTLGITADLLVAVHVRGEDWLQFRGPTGQGLSTTKNLPIEWSGHPKRRVEASGSGNRLVVSGRLQRAHLPDQRRTCRG